MHSQQYLLKNGTNNIFNISEGPVEGKNVSFGTYLNLDYELTPKQNLALTWSLYTNRNPDLYSDLFNTVTKRGETFFNTTQNNENSRAYNNSINLNYELNTDDKGSKLNTNVAYLNYKKYQNNTNST